MRLNCFVLIFAPMAALLGGEQQLAPRWIVREFASPDDYDRRKPVRELSFSPIIILDKERELSLNLEPGREPDEKIMEILDGQMLITLRAFRRAWARVIMAMPCQDSLVITTEIVPFKALKSHLGEEPDNPQRVARFTVESCLSPTPKECRISTTSPRFGSYEYTDFKRDLEECARAMQKAYQAKITKSSETKTN